MLLAARRWMGALLHRPLGVSACQESRYDPFWPAPTNLVVESSRRASGRGQGVLCSRGGVRAALLRTPNARGSGRSAPKSKTPFDGCRSSSTACPDRRWRHSSPVHMFFVRNIAPLRANANPMEIIRNEVGPSPRILRIHS